MRRTEPRPDVDPQARPGLGVTPMIDVVFLLLIFFLLASRFRSEDGKLRTYLPKDRGAHSRTPSIELADIRVRLLWMDEAGLPSEDPDEGRVVLKVNRKGFPTVDVEDGMTRRTENVPDWPALRRFLEEQAESYAGESPGGLPVIIDARPAVPVKHVVAAIDAAKLAGIRDLTFAAPEKPVEERKR